MKAVIKKLESSDKQSAARIGKIEIESECIKKERDIK